QVLHELFAGRRLELGCLVSSLAGRAGGLGYAAYAAGNRLLGGFACEHRAAAPYLALAWEGWTSWAGADALAAAGERRAWALSPEDAAAVFEHALGHVAGSRVAVSRAPLAARLARSAGPPRVS